MNDAMGWMDRAACRGTNPELFQDTEAGIPDSADARRCLETARHVCARCPVRRPCLEWALATAQPQGVWGGHTTAERRLLLRERKRVGAARRVTRRVTHAA